MKNKEIVSKGFATKDKNNSHNRTKPEKEILKKLREEFPKTEHQYSKDTRYPFNCDFYIPELDLFIEFQGFFVHGNEPYNGSNLPEIWLEKSKNSKLYEKAIVTYTESDPFKRKTAKTNKIRFLEIWYKDYLKGLDHILSLVKTFHLDC